MPRAWYVVIVWKEFVDSILKLHNFLGIAIHDNNTKLVQLVFPNKNREYSLKLPFVCLALLRWKKGMENKKHSAIGMLSSDGNKERTSLFVSVSGCIDTH
jgi:hypothetical protein